MQKKPDSNLGYMIFSMLMMACCLFWAVINYTKTPGTTTLVVLIICGGALVVNVVSIVKMYINSRKN